jgi:hypothetical protein
MSESRMPSLVDLHRDVSNFFVCMLSEGFDLPYGMTYILQNSRTAFIFLILQIGVDPQPVFRIFYRGDMP